MYSFDSCNDNVSDPGLLGISSERLPAISHPQQVPCQFPHLPHQTPQQYANLGEIATETLRRSFTQACDFSPWKQAPSLFNDDPRLFITGSPNSADRQQTILAPAAHSRPVSVPFVFSPTRAPCRATSLDLFENAIAPSSMPKPAFDVYETRGRARTRERGCSTGCA